MGWKHRLIIMLWSLVSVDCREKREDKVALQMAAKKAKDGNILPNANNLKFNKSRLLFDIIRLTKNVVA